MILIFILQVVYEREIETNLTFQYNVYNYMMAYGILRALGYKYDEIKDATEFIHPAKGRAEIIPVKNANAIIDYAHTPDAVQKMCESTRELLGDKGNIITIIGCGGNRDKAKRPIMGNLACSYSDHVIFTNDNPRKEDPEEIMNDITNGLTTDNYEIIYDRVEAINKGLDMLNEGDILLILGKGHEDYQIFGTEKVHYDDHEVVEEWKKKNIKTLEKVLEDKKTIPSE